MVIDDYRRLFADTEFRKNIIQKILITDLAGDLTEMIQCFPQIRSDKIICHFSVHSVVGIWEGRSCFSQGIYVSSIGNDGVSGMELIFCNKWMKMNSQFMDILLFFRRNKK